MSRLLTAFLFVFLCGTTIGHAQDLSDLDLDSLFPGDRVLDIQISVDPDDWNTIRRQSRDMRTEISEARKTAPTESPYTMVTARMTIDGIDLGEVGIRKKGFFGSQSTTRPSLKIKLNHAVKDKTIDGINSLTLNNNRQDQTTMNQFIGYQFFNAAGSPAPRCAFAKVTLNGKNLGIYSHVESARQPLLKRGFGDDSGPFYEGTVVDFFDGWEGSFDLKTGNDKPGRQKIKQLIDVMIDRPGNAIFDNDAVGKAWVPTKDGYDEKWTELEFDDSAWTTGRNGAGYETQFGYESAINDSFDFQDELYGKQASLCLRFQFDIEDSSTVDEQLNLYLSMKYDDGFVAWLNGQRIASANAPRRLRWNSRATEQHDDGAAMQYELFDISAYRDTLLEKGNVLAIQLLNHDNSSSDMLCVAEIQTNDQMFEAGIAEHVDLDAFFKYWAIEGLLGSWDGYAANRNNYFVYLNPADNKFHFMPWGLDAVFMTRGMLARNGEEPMCVKTNGRVAHKLYQTRSGRDRYADTMRELLDQHWDEEKLLAEVDRIEELVRPHLCRSQKSAMNLRGIRKFIKTRRSEIERELDAGLPIWTKTSGEPPIIREQPVADDIWVAARAGSVTDLKRHLDNGVDVNAISAQDRTPLSLACLLGNRDAVKFLLDQDADVSLRARGKQTVLHLAAFMGHQQVVEMLLENGADLNAVNGSNQSPLDICTTPWSEAEEIVEFLSQEFGLDFDEQEIKANREVVARLLKEKGARSADD